LTGKYNEEKKDDNATGRYHTTPHQLLLTIFDMHMGGEKGNINREKLRKTA